MNTEEKTELADFSQQLELLTVKLERLERSQREVIKRINYAPPPAASSEPPLTRVGAGERLANAPRTLNLWMELGMVKSSETDWTRFPEGAIQKLINENTISPEDRSRLANPN